MRSNSKRGKRFGQLEAALMWFQWFLLPQVSKCVCVCVSVLFSQAMQCLWDFLVSKIQGGQRHVDMCRNNIARNQCQCCSRPKHEGWISSWNLWCEATTRCHGGCLSSTFITQNHRMLQIYCDKDPAYGSTFDDKTWGTFSSSGLWKHARLHWLHHR